MIASVEGKVAAVTLDAAVIEVGGVGLLVHATPDTLARLRVGQSGRLATSMVVREESLTLYGFTDEDERRTFDVLMTVSGIGPRLALAMLAVHRPDDLRRAVTTEDLTALCKVPGIGKKGAQRLVLELADRLGAPVGGAAAAPTGAPAAADDAWRVQVREALVGLGWSAKQSEDAVDKVAPTDGEPVDVPALLRSALRALGRT